MSDFKEGEEFSGINAISKGEYVECVFKQCDFAETDFRGYHFESCTFLNCNLSNSKWSGAQAQFISFKNCKMLGNSFEGIKPFLLELHFEQSNLSYSSFYGLKLKGAKFIQCDLTECDFSSGDFSEGSFEGSKCLGAIFSETNFGENRL